MKFSVRSIPAAGHERRWRARRAWTRQAVVVNVVDKAVADLGPDEITLDDLHALQSDPQIIAMPLEGEGSELQDAAEVKQKLAAANAEIADLRRKVSQAHEIAEEERRQASARAEQAAARIVTLEAEVAQFKAQIVVKRKSA